jgi:hypothetical protein
VKIDYEFDNLLSVFTPTPPPYGPDMYTAPMGPAKAWVVKYGKKFKINKFGQIEAGSMENADPNEAKISYDQYLEMNYSGLRPVSLKRKWGYLDRYDRVVIPLKYDEVRYAGFGEFIQVKSNGKWGFLNKKGEEKLSPRYDLVDDFFNNMAPVRQDGKWGFTDSTGKIVIPIVYDSVLSMYNSTAVRVNNKWGIIDSTGKPVQEIKYDAISRVYGGAFYAVNLNNKIGFMDTNGKEVLPIIYDSGYYTFTDTQLYTQGEFDVILKGKHLHFDYTGKKIVK